MSAHDLKGLQVRLSKAVAETNTLSDQITDLSKRLRDQNALCRKLRQQIRELTEETKDIIVSEHALLRYLERVVGVDLDSVRSKVLPEETAKLVKKLGSGTYPVDQFKIIVKNGVVVSVK